MYEVIYSRKAEKFIEKQSQEIKKHILAVVERARIRPEKHFERLVGKETYKLRAGNYRIIADIQHGKLSILVIEVGYRRNIYK